MPFSDNVNEAAKTVGTAVSEFAKDVSVKTGEAITYGKQTIKIKTAEKAIAKAEAAIGAYYHSQHAAGQPTEEGIKEFIENIDAQQAVIDQAKEVIAQLKETEPAAAEEAQPETAEKPDDNPEDCPDHPEE